MERAIHTDLNPKLATLTPHLTLDQPNKYETHHAMRLRSLDHDSTTDELSTFGAHNKCLNQFTNNDNIQKVTINRNNRVSLLLNMDTQHKHNTEQGDITNSSRSFSYSASSSLGGNYGNHNNMINKYKARSFHAPNPTPPPSTSSSKYNLNNKAGLLFHHPQKGKILVNRPQTSFNKKIRSSLSKPFWLLRRKCPCNDKKSVQVKGNTNTDTKIPKHKRTSLPHPQPQPQTLSHNQIHKDSLNHKALPPPSPSPPPPPPSPPTTTTTTLSNKEVNSQRLFQLKPSINQVIRRPSSEAFTFPLFLATNSTNPTRLHHQVLLNVVHEEEDTTPNESLQVFQPPSPPKSRAMEDDAASDASSDLFEIESFPTQTTTFPYPIITPSITHCHETTDHEFLFAADAGSSLRRQRMRDTEVLPPT